LRTNGLLNPLDGLTRFRIDRYAPADDLSPFLDWHWIVNWDRRGLPAFEQEVLPAPCVHLSFRPGQSGVHGIGTRRFVARLESRSRVVGARFKPGAFVAFTDIPMAALVDQVVPVGEIFGPAGRAIDAAVLAEDDDGRAVVAVEAFLRSREPRADDALPLVARLVALTLEDRAIAQAADLAREASLSVRSLHRLFQRYVGLGPKWVIRRARVQEAAERVRSGAKVDWAALAQELGYHDQAHLIRDFKDQIGFTPAAYAARCAQAAAATS
jgi:AraC-like DNA-binding protein